MTDPITTPTAPALATIRGVELVQAGQWDLSTGPITFTRDDLANAVAALGCPAVRQPVLKLGHIDPRFDGQPAVGWVANMALTDNGFTIVGDYTGMPGWLGPVMASAYPDRSIEGFFDWTCQLGHCHPFVIGAVALLGVARPGVGTLDSLQDVAALYGVAAASFSGHRVAVTVHASKGDPAPMPNPNPTLIAAATATSTEDVRSLFYSAAPLPVWIVEIQLDPMQLITVDESTDVYARVPFTIGDDGVISFALPVPVEIQYVDLPAAGGTAAAAVRRIVYASRAESRPGTGGVAAKAIPVHHTPTDDGTWSGPAAQKNLDNNDGAAEYKQAYAWVDPDKDADTKIAYSFIHHEVDSSGKVGDANVKACQSGIGVLNGAMGGTTIPDGDKPGVYAHLAAHLTDAGVDVPELQAAAPAAPHGHRHDAPPVAATQTPQAEPVEDYPHEGDHMALDESLRERLGLDADASEEQILAALDTQLTTPAPDTTPAAPVPAALPEGTVAIDEGTLATLQQQAAEGVAARAQQRTEARDTAIRAAITEGRIPPARREHWTTLWDADPDGTRTTLASLAAGTVPLTDLGTAAGDDATSQAVEDAEYDRLFAPTATAKGA